MLEKKLEKKLKDFLEKNNRVYYKGSIEYSGLRNMKKADGSFRELHLVNFMVSISDQPYDGDGLFFATFDKESLNILEIVGPQSYEKFE